MYRLYDLNKSPIGELKDCKDVKIESELKTGDKSLSFVYPTINTQIQNEYYIRTETDEYVVKENTHQSAFFRTITAKLNLEDLEGVAWINFEMTEKTAWEMATYALTDTGWTCWCTVSGDKKRNITLNKVNAYNVFEKICEIFACEMRFDTLNKVVYLQEQIGENRGAYFAKDLNLRQLTDKSDTYDFYTKIIPIGADDLTIDKVNNGLSYLENHQYSDKVKVLIWEDSNYTDPQALKDDAEYKLNEISKPKITYGAKIMDLAKQSDQYSILEYSVGDTVLLIDGEIGVREEQRIVKTTEYPYSPSKNTCELSNTVLSFEDLQKQLLAAAEATNTVTNGGWLIGGKVAGLEDIQIGGIEKYVKVGEEMEELKAKKITSSTINSSVVDVERISGKTVTADAIESKRYTQGGVAIGELYLGRDKMRSGHQQVENIPAGGSLEFAVDLDMGGIPEVFLSAPGMTVSLKTVTAVGFTGNVTNASEMMQNARVSWLAVI